MLEKSVEKYKDSLKDADGELWAEKSRSVEKDKTISEQIVENQRMKFAV